MTPIRSIVASLAAVVALSLVAAIAGHVSGLRVVFGIVLPYAALATFAGGVIYRVMLWARSPVPFHIPTTCGQQKSLPWIASSPLGCPHTRVGAAARVAMEVLVFRSLFRNTQAEFRKGLRLVYVQEKVLWLAGLAFHWSLLLIVLRHLRLFIEPVPAPISLLGTLDSFFKIGVPALHVTDAVLVAAATFLFLRRVVLPQMRYISLPADYFPLFLILGIAITGMHMRHLVRVDIARVKEFAVGLATFKPSVEALSDASPILFAHLLLVSVLIAYFPFSKLMHMAGVFLSPTRNLPNDSRARRHVNPWDYPVNVHTYDEYEDEFRDKMKAAGIPVAKE